MKGPRGIAIGLLAVAAVASAVGAKTGDRAFSALAFACFAGAAVAVLRARRR